MDKVFWDDKFNEDFYIYGKGPNAFLEKNLTGFKPGKVLFAAEGEGRNAVFAAEKGWEVKAFDQSTVGQKKALELAEEKAVNIDYRTGDFLEIPYEEKYFDALVLIYAHFPQRFRKDYFAKMKSLLKDDGKLIVECFGENHPHWQAKNPKVGGPKDPELLFSTRELKDYFPGFNFSVLKEEVTELKEGAHHSGKGSVVRAIAKK